MIHNIYQKSLEMDNLGNKQRVKSSALHKKAAQNKIEQ